MWDVEFQGTAPRVPMRRGAPGLKVVPGKDGEVLTLADGALPVAFHYPFLDNPTLYRKFADVEPTTEGAFTFANEYGLLLRHLSLHDLTVSEHVAEWPPRIAWMRHMVNLWDQARPGGTVKRFQEDGLESLVRYTKDYAAEVREPDFRRWPRTPEAWRARGPWARVKPGPATGALSGHSLIDPVRLYLAERVNEELVLQRPPLLSFGFPALSVVSKADLRPEDLDPRDENPFFQCRPANLWQAMVLQFAMAMAEGARYRRCAICGTWLEHKREMRAENRTACSPSCRQKLYRQRKEEAAQLKGQGVKPEEIARRLDTDIATVRKWFQEKKGK